MDSPSDPLRGLLLYNRMLLLPSGMDVRPGSSSLVHALYNHNNNKNNLLAWLSGMIELTAVCETAC